MFDNKILITNIRKLCDENNIKITNLEKELGFGAGIISRWGNEADPSLSKIIQVADYFKVSLDELVGYAPIRIDDKFLESVITRTETNKILWNKYSDTEKNDEPKMYFDKSNEDYHFSCKEEFDHYCETHKELSYFSRIEDGFISIYGLYQYHNVVNPTELKFFIQPTYDAELIEQIYSYEQLKVLWLKIIYTIGDNAPSEIKAEELKNNFINNKFSNPIVSYSDEQLKQITKNMIEMEPQLPKLFEAITNPEFNALIDALKSPKLQQGLELAQRLSVYYSLIDHDTGHNIKKTP